MKKIFTGLALMALSVGVFGQSSADAVFRKKFIKKVMEDASAWQLQHPKHDAKDWTNGAFYAGLVAAWKTTKSKSIFNALMTMGDTGSWRPYKRWYHADDITVCQTYIDLYERKKDKAMIQPTIDTINKLLANPYPTKGRLEVIKWWWCDALFMAPPVLVKLAQVTGNKAYLDSNDVYFKQAYDLLYNNDEHLFARDLNYVIKPDGSGRKEANGQKVFWSRGNGWVMGGIVRILNALPKDHATRPFYENLLKEMAARVSSLQQTDGLWRASLLDPASYPGGEVSGSGFFCYAITWGINNNLLDKKQYQPVVEKAWRALANCVNQEGRVGWVQPIGASPGKNFSAESWEVYGTGAFLLSASEIYKLKK
jgi:rhamnogalacturonyl hydrolase YesR